MYEKLKTILKDRGLSVNKLAFRAEIANTSLYNALAGKIPMYPRWKKRISEFLELPEEEIFDDQDTALDVKGIEYAVHSKSSDGEKELIVGHYSELKDAMERAGRRIACGHQDVYIVQRQVSEWVRKEIR